MSYPVLPLTLDSASEDPALGRELKVWAGWEPHWGWEETVGWVWEVMLGCVGRRLCVFYGKEDECLKEKTFFIKLVFKKKTPL